MKDKQKLFDLQLADKQLEQLKEHLERMDNQLSQVAAMRTSLEEFKELEGNEELMVPIANGVFAKAVLKSKEQVRVNVGNGVVVNKTIDQAIALITTQIEQMAAYREQMLDQFNSLIQKAEGLAKELQRSQEV